MSSSWCSPTGPWNLRPYNLEQPLWLFVGSSVNTLRSDVLTVARFFHKTLSDATWASKVIGRLLKGKSGLKDEHGRDLFEDKFPYLRNRGGARPRAVYGDMLNQTLHAPSAGGLHIADIQGSQGELGLKAAGSDTYFGLVYIGDTSTFKKLVTEDGSGITVEEDGISGSLFDEIGKPDTTIETLIGSRKFIEGWNSWRVSNMGLLNIGKNEGSQIIQLFGRGVRLRGRGMTLKRSSALDGGHPEQIGLLETLNIFAVRANYMAQFRDYLEREGVPTEVAAGAAAVHSAQPGLPEQGPRHPEGRRGTRLQGRGGGGTGVRQGSWCRVHGRVGESSIPVGVGDSGIDEVSARSGTETVIPSESLDLVDWDRAYLSLIEHKERKGMDNLVVRPDALRAIMEAEPRVYRLSPKSR